MQKNCTIDLKKNNLYFGQFYRPRIEIFENCSAFLCVIFSRERISERIERKFESKQIPNLDVQFSNVHQEMNLSMSKHCTCSVVSYRRWLAYDQLINELLLLYDWEISLNIAG